MISWLLDNQILLIEFGETISQLEFMQVDATVFRFLSQSTADKVYVIGDGSQFKGHIHTLNVSLIKSPRHPKFGAYFAIGTDNPASHFFISVVARMFSFDVYFADSREAALQTIYELDPSISAVD